MFYRVTEASYPDREPAGHPRLEAVYERSMFELNEFFGIDWVENRPNVVLLPTRKIIDLIRGEATESWLVGWVSRRQVYLFSEDHYESECCHTYSEARYDATLKHELTHCFINVISGGTRNAIWLQE